MELLVTGAWKDAKKHIEELEGRGHRVHFLQYEKEELPCSPDQIEGVICNGLFLHHEIKNFTKLRYIQLTSAGYDRVPMDYIRERTIEINNARGVYSIPMAEFAIAGVLSLYKKLDSFRENQKKHSWEKERDLMELYGKKVCIFGCGNVGRECAKRFAAFGTTVVGVDILVKNKIICDNYTEDIEDFAIRYAHKSGFEALYPIESTFSMLSSSDIIISTLPIQESTKHFFDYDEFSRMRKNAIFINISRGATVNTKAIIESLDKKQIKGAVLDVFEEEPLGKESPLWDMKNVIISPHNSFVGEGNQDRLTKTIFENLERC